jgi:hypothetical protein
MNCPQCQTVNGSDAAFCGNCGARLAAAGAPAGTGGYTSATGTPLGYHPAGAPTGQNAAGGYSAPAGYSEPGGYNNAPPSYGPAGGQVPSGGYPQGQYQPPGQYQPAGQYQPPGQYQQGGYPQRPSGQAATPANFDINRLTTVDRIVAVATLVTMISIWLPWYAISFGPDAFGDAGGTATASGTAGHGWLWIEFIVALALLVYLGARAAWERLPFSMPIAHAPLLLIGTGLQLLLILIAFADIPYAGEGVGWGWAAFIGLLAALAAAGPVVYPAVKSYLDSRKPAAGPGAGPGAY